MKEFERIKLGLFVGLCAASFACGGEDGQDGDMGERGPQGEMGEPGEDGENREAGMDRESGMDGEDGEPGKDGMTPFPAALYAISHNGGDRTGDVSLRTAAFKEVASANVGSNEGLVFDLSNRLVQASDAEDAVALRTYCGLMGARFDTDPMRSVAGDATGLINPKGLAVANAAGVLIVANVGGMNIQVFGGSAAGDVAPLATMHLEANAWDVTYEESDDRLFIALTNGTIGVVDGYAARGWTGPVTRTITPVDDGDAKISTNLHGIAYDADSDALVVTDVGAANMDASDDFASDGAIYVIADASTADGNVMPWRIIAGESTMLGNPVDLILDGPDARVAEKAQGALLVFRDILSGTSGDIAPDFAMSAVAPESLAQLPARLPAVNASDVVDPTTPLAGVYVTSNPADTASAEAGTVSLLSRNLGSATSAFSTGLDSAENITLSPDGDAYVAYDDNAGTGGIAVVGRIGRRPDGTFMMGRDRLITGDTTGLIAPKGIETVDEHAIVLVADIGTDGSDAAIRVFSTCASGDAAPLANVDTAGGRPWDLHHDSKTDTLFAAFTNGTVGVYDDFSRDLGASGPGRTITPGQGGTQVSVNLHSVRYDVTSDTLILADVGAAGSNTDGQLMTVPFAMQADGMTEVQARVGGDMTNLGNPVDIAYDGRDLYVAEKANQSVLLFRDFLHQADGNIAPDEAIAVTAPESVVLATVGYHHD